MLPAKKYSQNIFIEITNLKHGGLGWELGTCLWSPVYNLGNTKSWKLMESVRPDDLIIHLVKINELYHFYAISNVDSQILIIEQEPPKADKWAGMLEYQRINLRNFNRLENPYPINSFFKKFNFKLKKLIIEENHQFYVEYGDFKELRVAQKYFAKCSESLYQLFDKVSQEINFNPILELENNNNYVPSANEPQNPDYNQPGRVPTLVSRIIRDTQLSRIVKSKNSWKCQICGKQIQLPNGKNYSEGHHLKPLGGEHAGPDIEENIIILCPTHHVEFDHGAIAINPKTYKIEHIDTENIFHGKELSYLREDLLGNEYIKYHYNKRFNNF